MLLKNIMVAFDGSDLANKALAMAQQIATQNDATLHVFNVNVIAASLMNRAQGSDALKELLDTAGENARAKAEELLKDATCKYKIVVQDAPAAAKAILDYSHRNDIDLIVMGSRGLGTMKQYFGSVAHAVLNVTEIPTLIIKK